MIRNLSAALAVAVALSVAPGLMANGAVTSSGSVVEIHLPAGTFVPDRPGTWSFQGVITVLPSLDPAGISRTVAQAFRSLFPGPTSFAEAPSTRTGSSHLERARALINSGDGSGARNQLEEALEDAPYEDLPELRFTLASALAVGGDDPEALHQLALVVPRPDDPWAKDFAILKATLLLDSSAFVDELAWLDRWASLLQTDPRRSPLFHFLRALGNRGVREIEAEQAELLLVHAPADSELGAAATSLLNDL